MADVLINRRGQEATVFCIVCWDRFTETKPCCCDEGTIEHESMYYHVDGVCTNCCHHGSTVNSHLTAEYERID